MRPPKTHCVIMFADLVGSTELYERWGDVRGRAEVSVRLGQVAESVAHHGGTVIKTIGDEVLCTYRKPEDAARAAAALHRGPGLSAAAGGGLPAFGPMRIGLHFGPVIHDRGDIYGRAVNLAARMVSIAKAKETLATRRIVEHLPAALRTGTRLVDRLVVKGRRGAIEVYELIWKEEDMTNRVGDFLPEALIDPEDHAYLLLSYQGREIRLDGRQPFVILGRSPSCDVVADDKAVSRLHLRIEVRRGRFYLIDHSSNGTYLLNGGGEEVFLCREETSLPERGRLSLGRSFREHPVEVVQFETPAWRAA